MTILDASYLSFCVWPFHLVKMFSSFIQFVCSMWQNFIPIYGWKIFCDIYIYAKYADTINYFLFYSVLHKQTKEDLEDSHISLAPAVNQGPTKVTPHPGLKEIRKTSLQHYYKHEKSGLSFLNRNLRKRWILISILPFSD